MALLLLFVALGYPACYLVTRASHGIVHVHWGALGRGGCSHLEPSGGGPSARAWAPAIAAETVVREAIDDKWGSCPAITE